MFYRNQNNCKMNIFLKLEEVENENSNCNGGR